MLNNQIFGNYAATLPAIVSGATGSIQHLTSRAQAITDRTFHVSQSIYTVLTSERNIRRYKAALWFCKEVAIITRIVCVALWLSLKEWCDAEVDRHTAKPEAVAAAQVDVVHTPQLLLTSAVKPPQRKTKRSRRGNKAKL
jgi:hypothetical protein